MNALLLVLALGFTLLHVLLDLRNFAIHSRHMRDWFTLLGVVALIGHVAFSGELASWLAFLTGAIA